MNILIVALSALVAALVVLALAVVWVASRYDRASRELSRYGTSPGELPAAPVREQGSPATPGSGRFRRRSRTGASARR